MTHTHAIKKKEFDLLGNIMAYESGELNTKETVKLFQHLLDTGQVWGLHGHYGRTAWDMLEAGLLKSPKTQQKDYYGNTIDFSHFKKVKK